MLPLAASPFVPTEAVPPMPMTNSQARALGLSIFPSFAACTKDGTNLRMVTRNQCIACRGRERQQRQDRERAIAERARAQALKEARPVILRELQREQKEAARAAREAAKEAAKVARQAEREAAKIERERERRRLKAADTRARNKAAKEAAGAEEAKATEAAAVAAAAAGQDIADPWDDDSAPWD